MNVLIVTNMFANENSSQPSQGTFVSEQVEALRRLSGIDVDVLVVKGFLSRWAYLSSLFEILLRLRSRRYDVIHYHFGLTAWSAPIVRSLTNSKIVITLHGSDVFGRALLRWITRVAVRFAHTCIAVSDEIRDVIEPVSPGCVTIPCAVDDTLFRPLAKKPTSPTHKTVIFPSSASRPEKDYTLFASVLDRLRIISTDVIVERRIENMSRDEVRDLLQQADALVMTSKREGSPQTIKEAMACGLPVVSVEVGDVPHLLQGVRHCRVVEHRDPLLIASALREVMAPGERTNGPERLAEAGYLSTDVAQRVRVIYDMVTKSKTDKSTRDRHDHK
ncbi:MULTISPECIES: glycosyltransferase family 4 protein [Paraburkholderia]|uniref:glycosyltransferase family 4 protein n=1 Tax=Paraburkholderia TaxID=1822464 RepID=UPI00225713AA|nr:MULTISPECIES: glycosyltransferase family 4 protein [Paraburkholderia]MCX4161558.1 glycosyltransferase family 4 protein [Paraburkholderia megapolitana]MDN7157054.1 glycosyltransferase family 4 protein [Paraburkholderia sp. CHISQ3]MDQ6494099.1 glycosyltransferase family 4 protein [Paraburkholderia megapolitana]